MSRIAVTYQTLAVLFDCGDLILMKELFKQQFNEVCLEFGFQSRMETLYPVV